MEQLEATSLLQQLLVGLEVLLLYLPHEEPGLGYFVPETSQLSLSELPPAEDAKQPFLGLGTQVGGFSDLLVRCHSPPLRTQSSSSMSSSWSSWSRSFAASNRPNCALRRSAVS